MLLEQEFWTTVIPVVKQSKPHFTFLAEVYWGMEQELMQQGFDMCYDKSLYDLLVDGTPRQIHRHLHQHSRYQQRLLRFIENHDEPRAAKAFPNHKGRAAAVLLSTMQGAKLYHEGQMEGFRVRIPVHLRRGPTEPTDQKTQNFYTNLLSTTTPIRSGDGTWEITPFRSAWLQLPSRRVFAWRQTTAKHGTYITIVNYSNKHVRGRLVLPKALHAQKGTLIFGSENDELPVARLLRRKPIRLKPWGYCIVRVG
jgi:glycosidase